MKSIGLKASLIVFVMALCVFFPISQSSKSAKLQSRITSLENRFSELQEAEMKINAEVAKQTSPDYVITMAKEKGIEFNQVGSQNSSSIAINF